MKQFNNAEYRIPSFVKIIGIGGFVVTVQLLMVHFKKGTAFFSPGADHITFYYMSLIAIVLLLSVVLPLVAYRIRKNKALIVVDEDLLCIREKAFSKPRDFSIADIASLKLYVNRSEKRSSMRLELKSGQVILLQFYHVIIAAQEFRGFMQKQASISVQDW